MQSVPHRQLAALLLLLLGQARAAPLQWESIQPVGLRSALALLMASNPRVDR